MANFLINIMSINVNSFNVSTMGQKNSKIYTKIEGVTSNKRDIILLSDCRLGSKGMDVERLFRLSRNGS